ncbi:MAG: hypothetical protein ACOYY2_09210 [Actinomycetota bacterium]
MAAGVTAAIVHGVGDLLPGGYDFIVPSRGGTRRPGVRLRVRALGGDEVFPVAGLPALTVKRTIADLIEVGTDESLVVDALRDAVRADKLVAPDRLVDYLGPVAKQRGTAGRALADNLFELAGVRPEGWDRG